MSEKEQHYQEALRDTEAIFRREKDAELATTTPTAEAQEMKALRELGEFAFERASYLGTAVIHSHIAVISEALKNRPAADLREVLKEIIDFGTSSCEKFELMDFIKAKLEAKHGKI